MKTALRRTLTALAALLLLLALLAAARGQAAAVRPARGAAPLLLNGAFTATVVQGPERGLVLTGILRLQVGAHGSLTGTLDRKTREPIRATGQLKGQLIGLYFNLGKGRNIFGTGVLGYDSLQRRNVIGGTFSGPSEPSSGVWDELVYGVKGPGGCLVGIPKPDSRPGLGGYTCYTVN